MGRPILSRELALCIGLAAKALPDTRPRQLIGVLADRLGLPLTQEKLGALTPGLYNKALSENLGISFGSDIVKKSLALLQGGGQSFARETAKSAIEPYRAGDMPHSIRVAVCSFDGVRVDGQFTVCSRFYVYQVSAGEKRLIDIREAAAAEPMKSEQKQNYRAEIVKDCHVLYGKSIGGPAAAKVVKKGVHPVKINGDAPIDSIIEQLQYVLATSPPPWLAKKMGLVKAPAAYDATEKMP